MQYLLFIVMFISQCGPFYRFKLMGANGYSFRNQRTLLNRNMATLADVGWKLLEFKARSKRSGIILLSVTPPRMEFFFFFAIVLVFVWSCQIVKPPVSWVWHVMSIKLEQCSVHTSIKGQRCKSAGLLSYFKNSHNVYFCCFIPLLSILECLFAKVLKYNCSLLLKEKSSYHKKAYHFNISHHGNIFFSTFSCTKCKKNENVQKSLTWGHC